MDSGELSMVCHIGLVLAALWAAGSVGWGHSFLFFLAFVYLFMIWLKLSLPELVNARCSVRLRKRVQYEEKKSAYQRRLLSDAESVRWLNHAVEKMWPICMEKIVSQLLSPIIPWFLDKFKPWTVSKASIQELYMGRNSPMFTAMRVLPESSDDDHLVLELGMNFLSAEDMSVVLAVQLNKSVGLGITTNMHLTSMHVEGKILVGVKFVRRWPFLGRVRLCFVEPPYFQMTVKPLMSHGFDVTELPGISGWLDKLMDTAFGQTLVEPNMLVINVEKFASAPAENDWFSIKEKPPIAYVKLEILEGADMIPADLNGLADPYVKGHVGPFRFQTHIQKKTLFPKWFEEFRIPITSWEAVHELVMEVRDKDPMFDDLLGECSININELKGGQRHDKWLTLKNVKKGRIHLAITVEDWPQEKASIKTEEISKQTDNVAPTSTSTGATMDTDDLSEGKKIMVDEVEHINIEGQEQVGGVYVHRPGSGVPKTWESRKGRARNPETQIYQEVDKSKEVPTPKSGGGGLFGFMFRKGSKKESPRELDPKLPPTPRPEGAKELDPKLATTPRANLKELGEKRTSIKIVLDEDHPGERPEGLTDEPAKTLTSEYSHKGSRKKKDKLPEVPEKVKSRESDLLINESNDKPIPVEGTPIVSGSTSEHGNVENAPRGAVEPKTPHSSSQ